MGQACNLMMMCKIWPLLFRCYSAPPSESKFDQFPIRISRAMRLRYMA